MEKVDLVEFSPVTLYEAAAGSNLKDGEMGLITAKKGLGKTAVLIQFGIDSLLRDTHTVHISFDQRSSNVIAWYDSILSEVAKKKHIAIDDIADDIMRERTILNFNQENFNLPAVVNTIKALKSGGINVKTLIIDGLNLDKIDTSDLSVMKKYIEEEGMTAWFSHTNESAELKDQVSADKLELFASVAHLTAEGTSVLLNILQASNTKAEGSVKLDPKTMLMTK